MKIGFKSCKGIVVEIDQSNKTLSLKDCIAKEKANASDNVT